MYSFCFYGVWRGLIESRSRPRCRRLWTSMFWYSTTSTVINTTLAPANQKKKIVELCQTPWPGLLSSILSPLLSSLFQRTSEKIKGEREKKWERTKGRKGRKNQNQPIRGYSSCTCFARRGSLKEFLQALSPFLALASSLSFFLSLALCFSPVPSYREPGTDFLLGAPVLSKRGSVDRE